MAIQFDADGQHNAEDLATLIEPLVDQNIDMVVGSRFLTDTGYKGMLMRRIGIYYFSKLLYVFTGKMFTDPTSGFRAVNRKVIETFAKDYPKDYPEPEVLIYLHNQGFSIEERSVYMKARQGGVSSITPIRSVYYMLKVTLSIVMQRLIRE